MSPDNRKSSEMSRLPRCSSTGPALLLVLHVLCIIITMVHSSAAALPEETDFRYISYKGKQQIFQVLINNSHALPTRWQYAGRACHDQLDGDSKMGVSDKNEKLQTLHWMRYSNAKAGSRCGSWTLLIYHELVSTRPLIYLYPAHHQFSIAYPVRDSDAINSTSSGQTNRNDVGSLFRIQCLILAPSREFIIELETPYLQIESLEWLALLCIEKMIVVVVTLQLNCRVVA